MPPTSVVHSAALPASSRQSPHSASQREAPTPASWPSKTSLPQSHEDMSQREAADHLSIPLSPASPLLFGPSSDLPEGTGSPSDEVRCALSSTPTRDASVTVLSVHATPSPHFGEDRPQQQPDTCNMHAAPQRRSGRRADSPAGTGAKIPTAAAGTTSGRGHPERPRRQHEHQTAPSGLARRVRSHHNQSPRIGPAPPNQPSFAQPAVGAVVNSPKPSSRNASAMAARDEAPQHPNHTRGAKHYRYLRWLLVAAAVLCWPAMVVACVVGVPIYCCLWALTQLRVALAAVDYDVRLLPRLARWLSEHVLFTVRQLPAALRALWCYHVSAPRRGLHKRVPYASRADLRRVLGRDEDALGPVCRILPSTPLSHIGIPTTSSFAAAAAIANAAADNVCVDIYAPSPDVGAGRPVLLLVYGGAWAGAMPWFYAPLASRLRDALGAVVAVPVYDVYPDVGIASQVASVHAALRWLQSHAARYGGDATNVTVVAHSSGAHIVTTALAYHAAAAVPHLQGLDPARLETALADRQRERAERRRLDTRQSALAPRCSSDHRPDVPAWAIPRPAALPAELPVSRPTLNLLGLWPRMRVRERSAFRGDSIAIWFRALVAGAIGRGNAPCASGSAAATAGMARTCRVANDDVLPPPAPDFAGTPLRSALKGSASAPTLGAVQLAALQDQHHQTVDSLRTSPGMTAIGPHGARRRGGTGPGSPRAATVPVVSSGARLLPSVHSSRSPSSSDADGFTHHNGERGSGSMGSHTRTASVVSTTETTPMRHPRRVFFSSTPPVAVSPPETPPPNPGVPAVVLDSATAAAFSGSTASSPLIPSLLRPVGTDAASAAAALSRLAPQPLARHVILVAGPYDLPRHWEHERRRGCLHHLSAMSAAVGGPWWSLLSPLRFIKEVVLRPGAAGASGEAVALRAVFRAADRTATARPGSATPPASPLDLSSSDDDGALPLPVATAADAVKASVYTHTLDSFESFVRAYTDAECADERFDAPTGCFTSVATPINTFTAVCAARDDACALFLRNFASHSVQVIAAANDDAVPVTSSTRLASVLLRIRRRGLASRVARALAEPHPAAHMLDPQPGQGACHERPKRSVLPAIGVEVETSPAVDHSAVFFDAALATTGRNDGVLMRTLRRCLFEDA